MGEKRKIIVHRFAEPDPTVFDPSPFVTKLEHVLHLAGIQYDLAKGFSPRAPKGKIPFVTLPSGKEIGDSTLCYQYLQKHENIPDVEAELTPEERATAASHKAWLEEWCYFLLLWDRYIDNFDQTKKLFLKPTLPRRYRMILPLINRRVSKYMKKTLWCEGILRHEREEIVAFIEEAAKNMSILVGEKGIMEGKAKVVNSYLLGFLVCVYNGQDMAANWCKAIRKYPNLRAFADNMCAEHFPERNITPLKEDGETNGKIQ